MNTISQILRAFHQPDRGQFGACSYCAHCSSQGDQQRCKEPSHVELPTHIARGMGGHCGPNAERHVFFHPNCQPAQARLAL